MRLYRETECSSWFSRQPLRPSAELRSYREIAAILSEQSGTTISAESVGKLCATAERRLAKGLRSDPVIARWIRHARPKARAPELESAAAG